MEKPYKESWADQMATNQMASAQSDQSIRCPHEESLGP